MMRDFFQIASKNMHPWWMCFAFGLHKHHAKSRYGELRMLERLFQLKAHNTTVRTEILAGLTTFLTMAYILFVNPNMLAETGMDKGAVFVATCLAAAIGSAIMGLVANYPIALAPGMGLNAFFTYTVVLTMEHTWQVALGAVFLSGVIFFLLSIFKIREWIINSIPMALRAGIAAGIGLFLAIIALKNAGIVVDNPATLVGLGDLSKGGPLLACLGFFVIAALAYRRVTGAVMIGILLVTGLSILFGLSQLNGVVSMPPALAPTLMQLDIMGALDIGLLSVIFAFLFVDLFDTSGTLVGVAQKANLLDQDGKMPKLGRALLADSTATMAGAALGTSTTTSYIESAAGISAGGRTGLTACVVAALFLLSLFFAPLAGSVPAFATAPALLFVAVLMMSSLAQIDWDDLSVAAPVVIAALAMPLTFSIANGIAFGFIAWTLIKLLAGRWRDLNPALVILSLLFVIKLGWFA
jgi:AGZA family xanthine/uracil permease-like MFS transporter